MTGEADPLHGEPDPGAACSRCGQSLGNRLSFRLRGAQPATSKCLRCSLIDRTMLIRSTRVAAIVGTALVALNQGDQLLSGTFPWTWAWYKIPLTYLVPFCVATYGALANGYRRAR